jgi:CubicO group peptidase (beta-lactamase class C family)
VSLDDALPAIEALVARTAAEHHVPSISWGIVSEGRLVHTGSVGTGADGRPPTADTVYRIASMTKSFTAAAVLTLRDEGVLALDDPIAVHAPELAHVASTTPGAAPIRIRDLLSMSAGIATDDAWADRHLDITGDELDAAIADGVLFAGEPGNTYEYSNLGYGLIGRVVRRATGQRVQDLISQRLLGPLRMTRSTWVRPDHDDWARPFFERDGAALPDEAPLGDGEIAPMGGIWTTVGDLARWITFLDDGFAPVDDQTSSPLRRSSRREMQQMHRYTGMVQFAGRTIGSGYGFGLRVRDDPRVGRVVTHSGGLPGYGSSMRWLSGRQFGVITLGNVTYAPMTDLGQAMIDVIADHDGLPPAARPDATLIEQLGRRLIALLHDWSDVEAARLFTDNVAADDPDDRRRADAARWIERCGGQLQIERVHAISTTTGDLILATPHGPPVQLGLQISPIPPARVQSFEFELTD